MKLQAVKTSVIVFIMIGIIGIALNRVFGEGTITFLQQEQINGQILYKMQIWYYIENIRTNVTDVSQLVLTPPTRGFNNDIINNLQCLADYMIFVANILFYPIRLGAYLMRLIFTIIGYDFTNPSQGIQWLVNLINNTIGTQIPYV